MEIDREYHVWSGTGIKTFMRVTVHDSAIRKYGDRDAIATAAWNKLMGRDRLGDDVDKKSPTRRFLRVESLSRGRNLAEGEYEAFDIFREKIKFQLIVR